MKKRYLAIPLAAAFAVVGGKALQNRYTPPPAQPEFASIDCSCDRKNISLVTMTYAQADLSSQHSESVKSFIDMNSGEIINEHTRKASEGFWDAQGKIEVTVTTDNHRAGEDTKTLLLKACEDPSLLLQEDIFDSVIDNVFEYQRLLRFSDPVI